MSTTDKIVGNVGMGGALYGRSAHNPDLMTAIALDDERPALEIIDAFCRRLEGVDLQRVFIKPAEARLYLMKTPVDLLFPDINMPGETGLGFIRSIAGQPLVIFTTAYSEYAVESYEVQAVDYLLKPFSCGRFEQAVQRAHHRQPSLNALAEPDKVEPTPVLFRADHGLGRCCRMKFCLLRGWITTCRFTCPVAGCWYFGSP